MTGLSRAARVISIDLDDTLWPVAPVLAAAERALLAWLEQHHPHVAAGHSLESMRAQRARIADEFPARSHDMTFLRHRALTRQFAAAGYRDAGRAESLADEAFEVFLAQRCRVEIYDDVRPALERLRARYRLFALSNGNAELQRCGLGDLFEGHLTAIEAGAAKPDARIFAELARKAGVAAADVLHIGDDPLADVVGARQAGMQAVWLNRTARSWPTALAPPPRTVSTLAEIL